MTDNSDEKSDPTGVDEYVTVIELFALLDPVSDEDADDGSVITSKTTQILKMIIVTKVMLTSVEEFLR